MTGDLTLDQTPATLRLVRLRLALALLAMAAVPLALGAIVLPALRGSESQSDRDRVAGASAVLSTAVAAELERTRSAVLL
ncbi:MAG TPA: hypothetical protein VFK38_11285, partial [Candidatus Limnocylindrales bacterium]|nr:hypothetical protein [Candidatus Limnocylindrales bacterium]